MIDGTLPQNVTAFVICTRVEQNCSIRKSFNGHKECPIEGDVMQLKELLDFDEVTIQMHDNPDADAIASGFALYLYFKSKGKKVTLIYSGRYQIRKTNLRMMIEQLDIPITYRDMQAGMINGLLITVDCQYGAGNVYHFPAEAIVVIDHHEKEINTAKLLCWEIASNLGSCSTLVWKMLVEEAYPVNNDVKLGTALYYGLYRDTNQFSEICYPLDMDMRESVCYDTRIIHLLRNSNLSLQELEIAGIALLRSSYNSEFHYSLIQAQTCDPNLLGLISDFLIQVDEITTCVVFNELEDGYKFSVRSCTKEVRASELAKFLAEDIGSGGGHKEKAGGFINMRRYDEIYPLMHAETYFRRRMNEYFESFDVIDFRECGFALDQMKKYCLKPRELGYAKADTFFPVGTEVIVRTLDGDMEQRIEKDSYILVGNNGTVRILPSAEMKENYTLLEYPCSMELEYTPRLKNLLTGQSVDLMQSMKACTYNGVMQVYAKALTRGVKFFPKQSEGTYMVGKPGDYLVVRCDNPDDVHVVEKELFHEMYQGLEEVKNAI